MYYLMGPVITARVIIRKKGIMQTERTFDNGSRGWSDVL